MRAGALLVPPDTLSPETHSWASGLAARLHEDGRAAAGQHAAAGAAQRGAGLRDARDQLRQRRPPRVRPRRRLRRCRACI